MSRDSGRVAQHDRGSQNARRLYYCDMRGTCRKRWPGLPILLAFVAGGCSSDDTCGVTTPELCPTLRATATNIVGNWRTLQAPSGIILSLSLNASDVLLSGTALVQSPGVSATGDVRGVVQWRESFNSPGGPVSGQPVILMNVQLSTGGVARFDQGTLRGDTLQGALTFAADSIRSYGLTLIRNTVP